MKKYKVYTEDFNGVIELKLSTVDKDSAKELKSLLELDDSYAVVWIES